LANLMQCSTSECELLHIASRRWNAVIDRAGAGFALAGRSACGLPNEAGSAKPKSRCSKARGDFTSYVGRRRRVQMVIEGGCHSTCITASSGSRLPAGYDVLSGRWRWVRSSLALRCSTEQNALHTLFHQRHLTPSCGGRAPTAERTLHPARIIRQELDPSPRIGEQNRPTADMSFAWNPMLAVPIGRGQNTMNLRPRRCPPVGKHSENSAL
jgi:hypothetical protein